MDSSDKRCETCGPVAEQRFMHTAKQGFVMRPVTSLDDSPGRETLGEVMPKNKAQNSTAFRLITHDTCLHSTSRMITLLCEACWAGVPRYFQAE